MDVVKLWAWRFAIGVSILMGIVSFYAGEGFLRIVISAILGFVLIYALSYLSILLFERFSMSSDSDLGEVGVLLDIAVGQDEEDLLGGSEPEEDNPSRSNNEPENKEPSKNAVERAQGNNGAGMAGQLNQDLADGLPSAEKQAEIVRRMGWEE